MSRTAVPASANHRHPSYPRSRRFERAPPAGSPRYARCGWATSTISGGGRFLQADPIGTQGGINLYGYVANDPLNATDPAGVAAQPSALEMNSDFQAGVGQSLLQNAVKIGWAVFGMGTTMGSLSSDTPYVPAPQLFGPPSSIFQQQGRIAGTLHPWCSQAALEVQRRPKAQCQRNCLPARRQKPGSLVC
jgi:hypothetical protein